jgi:hypothetical protein
MPTGIPLKTEQALYPLECYLPLRLRQPTVSPSGRRTPGLKLDNPRLLAVL